MNLSEFKAWFEGYTENMRDVPTAKQWARIKDRVGEITAQPTEIRYFYDHYWRPHYAPYWYSNGGVGLANANAATLTTTGYAYAAGANSLTSTDAFQQLGRAQYLSEAA